jgi:hypothetical protein
LWRPRHDPKKRDGKLAVEGLLLSNADRQVFQQPVSFPWKPEWRHMITRAQGADAHKRSDEAVAPKKTKNEV